MRCRVDAARFRNKKKPNYDVDKIVSIADSLECSSEKENIPLELSFLPTSNTPPFFTENMNKNDEMMQRNNKKNDSSKSANSIKIVKSQIIELFSSLNSSSAKSKLLSHVFVPSHDCVFHVPQRLKSRVGPISFDEAENDPSVGSRSGVKFIPISKKEENEGDFFERIESVSATAFPTLVSLKINTNKLDRIGDGNKGDEDANLKESGGDKETEVSVFRQGENVDVKVGFEENAIIISNDNNYDDDGDGNISNSTYSRIMYNDESNLLTYEISSNNDISLYSRQAVRTNDALYSKNEVMSAHFTDKDGNQNDHRKLQISENFKNSQDDNDDVKTAKKIENKNNKIIHCGNLKFVPLKGKSCKQISANEIEYKNILFKTTVKIDSKEKGNGSDKKSKEEDYVKEGNMKIKTREIIESKDVDQSDVINDTEIFDEFLNLAGEKGDEICNKTIEIFSKNLDVKKSSVPERKEKSPKTRGTSSELLAAECSKNISENGEEISPVETSLKFDDMAENLVTAEKEKDVKKLTRIKKIKIKSDMGKMKSMTGMKKEETKTDSSKAIDSDDFHDNIPLNSVARLSSRLPDSDSFIITAADSRANTFSLPCFPPLSPHRPSLEVCTNTFSAGAITSNLLKNMPGVRTMTPYALYFTEKYCEMNQKNPHHTPSGIVKLLSIEWKSLTKNEKKIWIQNSNLISVVVEPVEEVVAVGKVVKEIECVVKSKEEPERAISAINDDLLDRVDNIQEIQIEEKSSNQNKKITKKKNEDESNKKNLKRVRNKTSADDGSSKKRQTLNFRRY